MAFGLSLGIFLTLLRILTSPWRTERRIFVPVPAKLTNFQGFRTSHDIIRADAADKTSKEVVKMKHEAHSIIFKDEEGRWKYQDLVDAANSCEKNHAQMKGALMYIDTLVARLEAHDCFVDAREKAYKAGNNSPYAYRADEILCEHWIHGDWLKEAKRKSTECRDLAIAICVPINVIIAVIMSPIWLPFLAIWAASIKISDYLPEESRVQNILARIAVATGVPTTLIPGIVCEVVDRPIELLADFCQERVNSKTILP